MKKVSINHLQNNNENINTVPKLFERIVEHYGNSVAVENENNRICYTELNTRANRLSHYILAETGNISEPIILLFGYETWAIIAILAVLKAGKCYIPLDPSFPSQRIHDILQDSGAKLLLTSQTTSTLTSEITSVRIVEVESVGIDKPEENPDCPISPDNLAYIIYTSGSTGKPKGVMHSHSYILWLTQTYTQSGQITHLDRFALLYSPAFAGAVRDIFCTLLNGAALRLFEIKKLGLFSLRSWMIEQRITVAFFVATVFRHFCRFLSETAPAPPLRLIEIGSEVVHSTDVNCYKRYFPNDCRFIVNLGGTEISPITQYIINKTTVISHPLPVGTPVNGVDIMIFDENGHRLGINQPGEIVVRSRYLALGYWKQSEMTQARFVADSSDPTQRLYYTGDMGELLPDGNLLHLGRKDFQVKVRGYRIETGEVEGALLALETINEAIVTAPTDVNGDRYLLAYIVASQTEAVLSVASLRQQLLSALPDYMIPTQIVRLDQMPLTDTGKINRRALPLPDTLKPQSPIQAKDAQTDLERYLSELWAELFALKQISIHDNFFDLGGHSLLATQLVSRIRTYLGVELSLLQVFEHPVLRKQAQILQTGNQSVAPTLIPSLGPNASLPLSFAQQRLWFIAQLEGQSATYNMSRIFQLKGQLKIKALEKALCHLVDRHLSLRCCFPEVDGKPKVKIIPSYNPLHIINLSENNKETIDAIIQEYSSKVFDLANGPLLHVILIQKTARDFILLQVMHHIISDGWSMELFFQEWLDFYHAYCQEQPPISATLPIQYPDYAAWQRVWLQGIILEKQMGYWRKQLQDSPSIIELPTDYPRPAIKTYRGARHVSHPPLTLWQNLQTLSRQQNTTLFMTLLASFTILLSRYSRQEDICVGSPIANRTHRHTEDLIGFFANTLVLRTKIDNSRNFTELLQQTRQICLDAYTHQDIPFESLVEEISPQRSLSHTPLFQVMFVLQNSPPSNPAIPNLEINRIENNSPTARFDLVLEAVEQEGQFLLNWNYATDLFKRETIQNMAEHFEVLLQGIINDSNRPIHQLPILTEFEQRRFLEWSQTTKNYSRDKSIVDDFELQVDRCSTKVAVTYEEDCLTYNQLNEKANQLAHHLIEKGITANTLVGICLERSLEMIIGLLGILKAGGVYVPLDPDYPQKRLEFMLEDCQVELLITDSSLRKNFYGNNAKIIEITNYTSLAQYPTTNPKVRIESNDLAYIIYTSGSTGKPKGCQITHGNVIRLFSATNAWFGFNTNDVWTLFHSYAFDFSVWEIFGALLYGGKLVIVPYLTSRSPELFHQLLSKQQVTILNQTPSSFRQLIEVDRNSSTLLTLRKVIFGGEALEPKSLKPWFTKYGDQQPQLVNMYGITETTVHVTYYPLKTADTRQSFSFIGEPIPDLQLFILDNYQQLVPIGIAGELHVAGAGLARGYLNRPQLTSERFIEIEFFGKKHRLYKTGDLARRRTDGNIEYLGRVDHQVKLRGYRIELNEIEACALHHPAVRDCAVLMDGENENKRLVAYIVPNPTQAFPILKILEMRKSGILNEQKSLYELPNGMSIAHLNKTETDFVFQEIFLENHYLRHGITLQKGDCIFDVGANIGLFTLFVAEKFKKIQVFAFEPIPPVFELLRINTEIHGVNVKLFNCGLSKETGQDRFTFYPHVSIISGRFADQQTEQELVKSFLSRRFKNDFSSQSDEMLDELLSEGLKGELYTCCLRTLSDVIAENNLSQIDLLKIDVEKSEQDVLEGIHDEDWHKIKQLIVEVHNLNGQLDRITELLRNKGYNVTAEQEALLEDTELYNIYAIRSSPTHSNHIHPVSLELPSKVWRSSNQLVKDIRDFFSMSLPDYMIPSVFVLLEEFPLTSNGKLDRKSLPHPDTVYTTQYVAPKTECENKLVALWSELLKIDKIGIHDDFFDLGGHSLLMTQMILRVNRTFGSTLSLKEFYNCPTVAKMAAFINPHHTVTDDSLCRQLTREAKLSFWNKSFIPSQKFAANPPENILLTGANGFVGIHLLEQLLCQTNTVVYCLVRAQNPQHAWDRIREAQVNFGLDFLMNPERIIPLAGDLKKIKLGLSSKVWENLCESLDAIYHNGAYVHHLYPYSVLRKPNVQSVVQMIEMAYTSRIKSIHYVSTLNVSEKNNNREGIPEFRSGYVQSKWVAEQLLKETRQNKIPVNIYRLGQITGHSVTGACKTIDDNFLSFVKGCLQMGYAPKLQKQIELLPVDAAAKVIVGISKTIEKDQYSDSVFPICNNHLISWDEYWGWYQEQGYKIEFLAYDDWLEKLIHIPAENALKPLVLFYSDPYYRKRLQSSRQSHFDHSNTLQLLKRVGVDIPSPTHFKKSHISFLQTNLL